MTEPGADSGTGRRAADYLCAHREALNRGLRECAAVFVPMQPCCTALVKHRPSFEVKSEKNLETGDRARTLGTKWGSERNREMEDIALTLPEDWWTWSGSNRRPLPCHGSALPAAPQAHSYIETTASVVQANAALQARSAT